MLVLSRQLEEEIVIGANIRIKVVAISGNQVRLGIEAPADVTILRSEIAEEVARQNRDAAQGALAVLPALAKRGGPIGDG